MLSSSMGLVLIAGVVVSMEGLRRGPVGLASDGEGGVSEDAVAGICWFDMFESEEEWKLALVTRLGVE